jgi:polyhydroxyalkanoate synthesis regulator phasin
MGIGFASYAQEKATDTLKDVKNQAQKLADEMAERGEMSAEEARKFVDELVEQAQQATVPGNNPANTQEREPRKIEIVDEDEVSSTDSKTDATPTSESKAEGDDLRQQVRALQEELRRLREEM